MKATKGARKIVLDGIEFRWRTVADSGILRITIWPVEHPGSTISGTLKYDARINHGDFYYGCWVSKECQIVITSKFIRRIVEYARAKCGYSHLERAPKLSLDELENKIDCSDILRAEGNIS